MKNLYEQLVVGRRDRQAMGFDEVRRLVEELPNRDHSTPSIWTKRRITMTASGLIVLAIAAWFVGGAFDEGPKGARPSAAAPANVVGTAIQKSAVQPLLTEGEAQIPSPPKGGAGGSKRGASSAQMPAPSGVASLQQREGEPDSPAMRAQIAGIRLLELSPEELLRLGIEVDSIGVWFMNSDGSSYQVTDHGLVVGKSAAPIRPASDTSLRRGRRFVTTIDSNGTTVTAEVAFDINAAARPSPPPVSPSVITDDLGNYRLTRFSAGIVDGLVIQDDELPEVMALIQALMNTTDAASRLNLQRQFDSVTNTMAARKMGGLVGILIRADRPYTSEDSVARRWRPDCIAWYPPTPELLALLPDNAARPIAQEVECVESRTQRELPACDAIDAVPGRRPFLDHIRSTGGAIVSTQLSPNPTERESRLTFALSEAREVEVAVTDISGHPLRVLAPRAAMSPGKHTIVLDVKDLPEGIYLVVLTTDRKEQAVQRLLVAPD